MQVAKLQTIAHLYTSISFIVCYVLVNHKVDWRVSSLGRYVFGSEISYNKPPPRLPALAYLKAQSRKNLWDIEFQKIMDHEFPKIHGPWISKNSWTMNFKKSWDIDFQKFMDHEFPKILGHWFSKIFGLWYFFYFLFLFFNFLIKKKSMTMIFKNLRNYV